MTWAGQEKGRAPWSTKQFLLSNVSPKCGL